MHGMILKSYRLPTGNKYGHIQYNYHILMSHWNESYLFELHNLSHCKAADTIWRVWIGMKIPQYWSFLRRVHQWERNSPQRASDVENVPMSSYVLQINIDLVYFNSFGTRNVYSMTNIGTLPGSKLLPMNIAWYWTIILVALDPFQHANDHVSSAN